ncbi:MAG: hypothetical protein ACO1SV_10800 [Fimbriimonas sp.]
MRRLAKVVIFLIAVGAAYWFLMMPKRQETAPLSPDVWVGSEESGCMYPVDKVMDGKNPEWWAQNRSRWNEFESKKAAAAAGYRECPQ